MDEISSTIWSLGVEARKTPLALWLARFVGPFIGFAIGAWFYFYFPKRRKVIAITLLLIGLVSLAPLLLCMWKIVPWPKFSDDKALADAFLSTVFIGGLTCFVLGGGLLLYIIQREREEGKE